MTVAEMIKQTRTESNMTQEEYGLKFGVTRQTVSSWENERSMPDLQMLIDICNTYHVSLDKLLNEDKGFVDKIDFYGKIKKFAKTGTICLIIALVLLMAILVRWKIISTNMNETFTNNATQLGFTLENGVYQLKEDDICYQLPNQKLPFLKGDFYVKSSYSDFKIDDTEIGIDIYDENRVVIEFNHYRAIKGNISKTGEINIIENTLNTKENEFYVKNNAEIKKVFEQLLTIHNSVYSY